MHIGGRLARRFGWLLPAFACASSCGVALRSLWSMAAQRPSTPLLAMSSNCTGLHQAERNHGLCNGTGVPSAAGDERQLPICCHAEWMFVSAAACPSLPPAQGKITFSTRRYISRKMLLTVRKLQIAEAINDASLVRLLHRGGHHRNGTTASCDSRRLNCWGRYN